MQRCLPFSLLAMCLTIGSATGCTEDEAGSDGSGGGGTEEGALTVVTPRFEPDGDGFFTTPWPTDRRLTEDGHVDLSAFPQASDLLVGHYLDVVESSVIGFSTMPVVYFLFDQLPTEASLPSPAETVSQDAPIQLFEVSAEGCGNRIPVEPYLETEGDDFIEANTLAIAPVPGFVLRPATPYAAVVLRSFGAPDRIETAVAPEFAGLLDGSAGSAELLELYAPLRGCLQTAGLSAQDVAVATVFTTQDPISELVRMREIVIDPTRTPAPVVSNWELSDSATTPGRFVSYRGTYETPIFQNGQSPYAVTGGVVELDGNGDPIIQRWEEVPFIITYPEPDDGPFPVMIWEDGTGATLEHHIRSTITSLMLRNGFAIASFEAQFHGDRATPSSDPELHTFNYLNPGSFRTVLRQQAVDTAYFIRVLREAAPGLTGLPTLDTSSLVYGGQSQGALVGAICAGLETDINAYALNGIGAYLSITMIERRDPIDINAQVVSILDLDRPLNRFHPIVALAQLGGDASDPINYAPRWRGWAEAPSGANVFLINGRLDVTTPERSINAVTISGNAAPVAEPGWNVDPFGVWTVVPESLPVSGNTTAVDGGALTIATILDGDEGHFTIYNNEWARHLAVSFWVSAAQGLPVITE